MNDKPRLIEAGALSLEIYKRINQMTLENEELTAHDALIEAMRLIKEVPTIDAVPAVHGKWLITEYDYFDCSVCEKAYFNGADSTAQAQSYLDRGYAYNYCPYCGAKMDLEDEPKNGNVGDKDIIDWLNSDLEELIDFDYTKGGEQNASK